MSEKELNELVSMFSTSYNPEEGEESASADTPVSVPEQNHDVYMNISNMRRLMGKVKIWMSQEIQSQGSKTYIDSIMKIEEIY